MVMLYSVMMLSRLYIMEDLPKDARALYAVSSNRWVILFMINVFLVIMGMLMDDISSVTLTTPILMPIILELGQPHPLRGHRRGQHRPRLHHAACGPVRTSGTSRGSPINEMMGPTMWIIALCGPHSAHHHIFPEALPLPAPFPARDALVEKGRGECPTETCSASSAFSVSSRDS